MADHGKVLHAHGGEEAVEPLKPRAVLMVRRADLLDALEAAEAPQRNRLRLGLGFIGTGLLFTVMGFMGDQGWFWMAMGSFSYPAFGAGWFLMAQQEIGRLRREVRKVEEEMEALPPEGPMP